MCVQRLWHNYCIPNNEYPVCQSLILIVYYKIGNIELDSSAHSVLRDGEAVSLTPLEYALLEYLMRHPNRLCKRAEIIDRVWGQRFRYDTGTIDVHLNALRRKLGFSKGSPIETIRGVGLIYRSESAKAAYTIDLQAFVVNWLRSHEAEIQAHGLVPDLHLTPFVNELTIQPEALQKILDANLAALLPTARPGRLRINSKLTVQHFIFSLDINGTVSELRIPINRDFEGS